MAETSICIELNGERKEVEAGTSGTLLFADDKQIIAIKLNGELRDLSTELKDGDTVSPVVLDSDDGLSVMRHSATHVMAQAVQELYPGTKLGVGPVIENGFYYDFDVENPFTPEDLKAIEKKMQRIIKEGQTFKRRTITEEQAREEEAGEPYKLELIDAAVENIEDSEKDDISSREISMYDNVDRNGKTVWSDLCRGPHLPNTRFIKAFKLQRASGAYWRGNEKNPMLQRIYGTAWASKDDLKAYQTRMEEAAKRDHRRIGAEMDLFSFPEEIGSGLAVFHPKGASIINAMKEYSRQQHLKNNYSFVQTPHITKGHLYEISGHLQWYKDGMYPPMRIDEEKDEAGNIVKQGFDYYLKPMNCPIHNLIFKSRQRSYRELPLRLFEFGTVYRYEKSGVVHGLTRVRGLTQDDSHIYCTREQMRDELKRLLEFVLNLLKDFGLEDFYLELSTKDPDKFVGSDEIWEEATNTLAEVAAESGLELVDDPCGAAFYGPKISVQARDAIGRTWQVSTIQLDFNLPERFDLEYVAADGTHKRPVMIHRALFGSLARFFGILVEHYAGVFPLWLAPEQLRLIPITEKQNEYCLEAEKQLKARGFRVSCDTGKESMGAKIKDARTMRIPYMAVVGEKEVESGKFAVRSRREDQLGQMDLEALVKKLQEDVDNKI